MKFLRSPFLKHLFVLRSMYVRVCVLIGARVCTPQARLVDVTTFYRESPGWASNEGLGSPQKLICNFNIPLFIPTKSVGSRTGI